MPALYTLDSARPIFGYRNYLRNSDAAVSSSPTLAEEEYLLYASFGEACDLEGASNTITFTVGPPSGDRSVGMVAIWISGDTSADISGVSAISVTAYNNLGIAVWTSQSLTRIQPDDFGSTSEDPGLLTRPFWMHIWQSHDSIKTMEVTITVASGNPKISNVFIGPYMQTEGVITREGLQYDTVDESIVFLSEHGADASFGRPLRRRVQFQFEALTDINSYTKWWQTFRLVTGAHRDVLWVGRPGATSAQTMHDYTFLGFVSDEQALKPQGADKWRAGATITERI